MDLDLRTVRYKYWKSGGDMRLFYREAQRKEPTPEQVGRKEGEGGRASGGEQDKKGEEKTDSEHKRSDS